MGNLKQRLIKAGTEYNYAEGVKVKAAAGVDIAENEIVVANGYSGPFIVVTKAVADPAINCTGRLMIAKHAIPAGGYGVVLPWKLVTGINTASSASVGVPVYLSATTAGGFTFTAPSGGTTQVVTIGSVVEDHATTGGILFCTDMGKL